MTGTMPPPAGKDRMTPGVKAMNKITGTIRSARVVVNLKTKLMMTQESRAKTRE